MAEAEEEEKVKKKKNEGKIYEGRRIWMAASSDGQNDRAADSRI